MATLPIVIDSEDKIAIIAPHPDDECIGVGGILSLYPELCDVFVLTDGRYGGKGKKMITTQIILLHICLQLNV